MKRVSSGANRDLPQVEGPHPPTLATKGRRNMTKHAMTSADRTKSVS
jgi:hypothetical protein